MRRKCENVFLVCAALLCGFSFELGESAEVGITQTEKQVGPVPVSRDILGISVPDFIETETKDDEVVPVPATLATTVGTTPVSLTEVPEKVVTVNSVPFVSLESTTPTATSSASPDVTSSTSTIAPISSTDATTKASVSPTTASPAQVPEVKELKLKTPDNIEDLLPKVEVKAKDTSIASTLPEQSTTTLSSPKESGNVNVVSEQLRDASSTTEAADAVETTTEGPVILRPKEKSTPGPVFIPAPTDALTVCPVCGHVVSPNGHICESCGTNLEHPLRHSVPFVSYSGFGRTNFPEPQSSQGILGTKKPTEEEKYFFPQRNAAVPPAQPVEPSPTPLRTIPVRAYVDLNAINLEKMRQNFWRTEVYKQAIGLGPAYMQRGDPTAQFQVPVPAPHERYLQPVVQGNGAPQYIQVQGTVPQRQYQVSGPQPKWSFSLPNLSSWFKLGSSTSNEQNGTPVKNVRTHVAPSSNSGPGPAHPAEGIEPRNPAPKQGSIASFFNCPLAKQGH